MQVHPRKDGFEIDGVLVSESVMAEDDAVIDAVRETWTAVAGETAAS